jgi:flagellar FliJ protein
MAQPKPGKRFKYDLDTVLKVRGIREKKEQEKFAEKRRDYLLEKEREDEIERDKRKKEEELRGVFRKGPISNFEKVMRRRSHLDVLKDNLDDQVEKVIEANRLLEEQRSKLIEAVKDKKIMEKHREKKLDQYNKLMNDLESKFMDEIATQRFKRREEP